MKKIPPPEQNSINGRIESADLLRLVCNNPEMYLGEGWDLSRALWYIHGYASGKSQEGLLQGFGDYLCMRFGKAHVTRGDYSKFWVYIVPEYGPPNHREALQTCARWFQEFLDAPIAGQNCK